MRKPKNFRDNRSGDYWIIWKDIEGVHVDTLVSADCDTRTKILYLKRVYKWLGQTIKFAETENKKSKK